MKQEKRDIFFSWNIVIVYYTDETREQVTALCETKSAAPKITVRFCPKVSVCNIIGRKSLSSASFCDKGGLLQKDKFQSLSANCKK